MKWHSMLHKNESPYGWIHLLYKVWNATLISHKTFSNNIYINYILQFMDRVCFIDKQQISKPFIFMSHNEAITMATKTLNCIHNSWATSLFIHSKIKFIAVFSFLTIRYLPLIASRHNSPRGHTIVDHCI